MRPRTLAAVTVVFCASLAATLAEASPCGPLVRPNGTGGSDVRASGDATGVTDRADLLCALETLAPGGEIDLIGRDFYLSGAMSAYNIVGTLRGQGREATTLHAVEGFEPEESVLPFPTAHLIAFGYDDDAIDGALTISDLSITLDGPAALWFDGGAFPTHAIFGFHLRWTGSLPPDAMPTMDLDVTFEHLGAVGTLDQDEPGGTTLTVPWGIELGNSGHVVFRDIVTDQIGTPVFVSSVNQATVTIGGSQQGRIVARDSAGNGVHLDWARSSRLEVSHVEIDGAGIGIYFASGEGGNTLSFVRNTLRRVLYWGVFVGHSGFLDERWDPSAGPSSVDVSHNVIESRQGTPDGIGIEDGAAMGPRNSCHRYTETWPRAEQPLPSGVIGEALPVRWGGVLVPDPPELDGSALTLAGWLRPASKDGWSKLAARSFATCDDPWMDYALGISGEDGTAILELTVGGGYHAVHGTTDIPIGAWTHLAATYDGAEMRVYVNGELEGWAPLQGRIDASDAPFTLGRSWGCGDFFEGLIDDVRLYDFALDADAIEELLSASEARGDEVAYYPADQGSFVDDALQRVLDASGQGHDGMLSPTCPERGTLAAKVSHNTISLDTPFGGIYGHGTQDMVIAANRISGHMAEGIYLSFDGEPLGGCLLQGNNVEGVIVTPSEELSWLPPSRIFLGWGTHDCRVAGSGQPGNVLDLGHGNHVKAGK